MPDGSDTPVPPERAAEPLDEVKRARRYNGVGVQVHQRHDHTQQDGAEQGPHGQRVPEGRAGWSARRERCGGERHHVVEHDDDERQRSQEQQRKLAPQHGQADPVAGGALAEEVVLVLADGRPVAGFGGGRNGGQRLGRAAGPLGVGCRHVAEHRQVDDHVEGVERTDKGGEGGRPLVWQGAGMGRW